jgi:hypothetical protein
MCGVIAYSRPVDIPNQIRITVLAPADKNVIRQPRGVCYTHRRVEFIPHAKTFAFMLNVDSYTPVNFNRPSFDEDPMQITAYGVLVKFDDALDELPVRNNPYLLWVIYWNMVSTSWFSSISVTCV